MEDLSRPAIRLVQAVAQRLFRTRDSARRPKETIHGHPQFAAFVAGLEAHFAKWRQSAAVTLRKLKPGCYPKDVIRDLSEGLLAHAEGQPLVDPYAAIYQHLMDYWAQTMQDDCYLIAADGWVAKTSRIIETDKKGKTKDKGWTCDLVPKGLIVARYFAKAQAGIDTWEASLEAVNASLTELEEEHGGEGGYLGELERIAKTDVMTRFREIKSDPEYRDEAAVLERWLSLNAEEAETKRTLRELEAALGALAHDEYARLSPTEIQTLVVDDKWLTSLHQAIQGELDRVSQTLTTRIRVLADRCAVPLAQIIDEVAALAAKVDGHLKRMGVGNGTKS